MSDQRIAGQQSVRRAVEVLFCLEEAGPHHALSAAEIAERSDLNRTTAWRYLHTLAASGLARDVGHGRFGLGARTVGLAEAYARQWGNLEAIAVDALTRLRDSIGETAALHLRQGESRVVVRQVESRHELHRVYRELGQPISLLAGAPSLAILSALPEPERIAYLDAHADPVTRQQAERGLAEAAAAGYAVSRGSRVSGVASVAAPVRAPEGEVIAALNITGPAERLPESRTVAIAAEVSSAAEWVESQLSEIPADVRTRQTA